jgi:hypothetical protein
VRGREKEKAANAAALPSHNEKIQVVAIAFRSCATGLIWMRRKRLRHGQFAT